MAPPVPGLHNLRALVWTTAAYCRLSGLVGAYDNSFNFRLHSHI